MKYYMFLLFSAVLIVACSTTKEVEEDNRKMLSAEYFEPQTLSQSSAKRGSSIDPELLAFQLGLEGETKKEFVDMWNKTTKDFEQARIINKGNKSATLEAMRAVKDHRTEELNRLLTNDQLSLYYHIMQSGRGKISAQEYQHKKQ